MKREQLDKLCLIEYSLRKCERITLNFIPPISYLGHNCLLYFLRVLKYFFFGVMYTSVFVHLNSFVKKTQIFIKMLLCFYLATIQFSDLCSLCYFRQEILVSPSLVLCGKGPGVCFFPAQIDPSASRSPHLSWLLSLPMSATLTHPSTSASVQLSLGSPPTTWVSAGVLSSRLYLPSLGFSICLSGSCTRPELLRLSCNH